MITLEGIYDLHVHPAPSIQKRKFTALEAIKKAHEEGMAGILFLDHTYNTTTMAETINEMGFKTKAFGAIMLNEAVGGINPSVVEIAIALGTKQIQMPTYSSKAHLDAYGDDQKIFPYKKRIKPIYVLDEWGRLVPEVEEIINLVKGSQSFLATGHLSTLEVDAIVKRAKEVGCMVMICSVSTDMPGYSLDAQKRWASENVFMEHDYMAITDIPHVKTSIETIVTQIKTIGAERCVLGSDAGNVKLPDNVTAMKEFIGQLMKAGISEKEIDIMTRENPKILLGIS